MCMYDAINVNFLKLSNIPLFLIAKLVLDSQYSCFYLFTKATVCMHIIEMIAQRLGTYAHHANSCTFKWTLGN